MQNCEAETFPEKLVLRAVNRRKGPISPYEKAHLKPSAIVNRYCPCLYTDNRLVYDHS